MATNPTSDQPSFLRRFFCVMFGGHRYKIIQTPAPQPLIWHCKSCGWRHTT